MPSWPDGVTTTTLLFGKGITIGGNMTSARLTVEPIFQGTDSVVWAADGTPMLPFSESASADDGSYGSIAIPVVDQAGWLDSGQHAYTLWGYKLTETPSYGRSPGKQRVKYWQPLTGQATVDFDRIPDGSIGLPSSGPIAVVTSVNGQVGAVTVTVGDGAPDSAVAALVNNSSSATRTALAATYLMLNSSSRLAIGGTQLDPAAIGADPAGAASAVTLSSLGGITPAAVDTKVSTAVTGLLNGAPGALDTLKELADALGDDSNFASTVATQINSKLSAANNLSDLSSAPVARTNLGAAALTNGFVPTSQVPTANRLTAAAQLSANFVNSDYRMLGIGCGIPDLFTSTFTPASLDLFGRLIVNPTAYTNMLPNLPFTGAIAGVEGAGGVMPIGWTTAVAGVAKSIMSCTADTLIVQLGPYSSNNFGGIRSPAFTPGGAVNVTMTVEVTGLTNGARAQMFLGWFASGTTTDARGGVAAYFSDNGKHRFTVTMPDPGTAASISWQWQAVSGVSSSDLLTFRIEKPIVTLASVAGTAPQLQPPYATSTQAASAPVLAAPDGSYVLVADTVEAGPMRVNVLASSGAGVNIASALGGFAVLNALYLLPAGSYDPTMVDHIAPLSYRGAVTNPSQTVLPMVSRALRTVLDTNHSGSAGATARSVAVADNRPGWTRFEVHAGDAALGDGSNQERAEFQTGIPVPYDTDVWTAASFRVLQYPYESGNHYAVLHQYRYTNDAGDSSSMSPDFSMYINPSSTVNPDGSGTYQLLFITRSDKTNGGSSQVNPTTSVAATDTTTSPSQSNRYSMLATIGKWYSVVYRLRFSVAGNGWFTLYINGTKVFDQQVQVGYNRTLGPSFHYGVYRNPHSGTTIVEHVNVETGTTDLTARATLPLPL